MFLKLINLMFFGYLYSDMFLLGKFNSKSDLIWGCSYMQCKKYIYDQSNFLKICTWFDYFSGKRGLWICSLFLFRIILHSILYHGVCLHQDICCHQVGEKKKIKNVSVLLFCSYDYWWSKISTISKNSLFSGRGPDAGTKERWSSPEYNNYLESLLNFFLGPFKQKC